MFRAARSGKQYLAIECLENRRLLSADFDVAESNVNLPKLPPAPAILTIAATAVAAGDAESVEILLGKSLSDNGVQLQPFLGSQIGEFELDELEAAPTQHGVNIQFQDNDDSEVDDVEIELREPTAAVASRSSSVSIVVAKPNHIMPIYFAMPAVRSLVNLDAAVAPEQGPANQPNRESLPNSKSVAENAIPIQLATAEAAKESEPRGLASEYVPVPDALCASETKPIANSLSGNITVEGVAPIEAPPVASESVQELSTDVVAQVAQSTRALFTAGLSGDYEAIDLAMSQLLSDLDTVRSDATLLFDESILRGVACTAVVGAVVVGVARRRILETERSLNHFTIEEHLALWMYPECSGISGGPTL